MSYTTDDFSESLNRAGIEPSDVRRVVAAWGRGDGMGVDAGHLKWAEDGATDWSGGFLFELNDGRFVYLEGWCDYTGWGCQDGVYTQFYDSEPPIDVIAKHPDSYAEVPPAADWDVEPADLNRWVSPAPEGTAER